MSSSTSFIFSYTSADEKVVKDSSGKLIGVGDGVVGKVKNLLSKEYQHVVWWGLDMQTGATGFEAQYVPKVLETRRAEGYGVCFISKYFVNREISMKEYELLSNEFGDKRICVLLDSEADIKESIKSAISNGNAVGSPLYIWT